MHVSFVCIMCSDASAQDLGSYVRPGSVHLATLFGVEITDEVAKQVQE